MTLRCLVLTVLLLLGSPGGVLAADDTLLTTPGSSVGPEPTVNIEFLPALQALVLRLPPGTVPKLTERRSPPRIELEIPGTRLTQGSFAFATGLVSRYEVVHVGEQTRAILFLRKALTRRPLLSFHAERAVLLVDPSLVPDPRQLLPTGALPSPFPTPKPRVTPFPTTPPSGTPRSRITPVPVPSSEPSPRDIPPLNPPPGGPPR
jgi:hypothetical protein